MSFRQDTHSPDTVSVILDQSNGFELRMPNLISHPDTSVSETQQLNLGGMGDLLEYGYFDKQLIYNNLKTWLNFRMRDLSIDKDDKDIFFQNQSTVSERLFPSSLSPPPLLAHL